MGVQPGRYSFEHEGDVVVFLIGMRLNKVHKVHKWLPVAKEMPKMMRELAAHPEKGFLGSQQFWAGRTIVLVQYWRSFEHLERFARSTDDPHLGAWRRFNGRVGTNGDVGIFHETYLVPAGNAEAIYNNMPPFGLAAATASVPIAQRGQTAGYRIGRRQADEPAVPVPAAP